jgi:hypothetical protein
VIGRLPAETYQGRLGLRSNKRRVELRRCATSVLGGTPTIDPRAACQYGLASTTIAAIDSAFREHRCMWHMRAEITVETISMIVAIKAYLVVLC